MKFGNRTENINSKGQMTIELAVCIPVIFVLVAITYNLLSFMGYCAAFDRLVEIDVEQLAVSPAHDEYARGQLESRIQGSLRTQLVGDTDEVRIVVKIEPLEIQNGAQAALSLLFPQERLTAQLSYQGWFFGITLFDFTVPGLTHEKTLVFSPYQPGVVV